MKILKFLIIFFLISCFKDTAKTFEIRNLASINNKTITNIDLYQEIKVRELLDNVKINKNDHGFILEQMIGEKIKQIESEINGVKISNEIINRQFNSLKKNKLNDKKFSKILEKSIILKIETTYKWNKLIGLKYNSKLAINIDEINEIMKSKEISEDKRDQLVNIEKKKKINTFSKTHFNKIKKKYLVKKY